MPKTAAQKTINEKIEQLNQEVEWFYGEDFALDQALDKYQAATKLAEDIEKDLNELKNKVEVLKDFTKS